MMLDIDTPKGQESLVWERRAIELFHLRYPAYELRETDKTQPDRIDGYIHDRATGNLRAVVENKCRPTFGRDVPGTVKNFERICGRRWLVTSDKLDAAMAIATAYEVPVVGCLYLPLDDVLFVQKIFNADGTEATSIERRTTTSQRTINGGTATRLNAFVLVTDGGYTMRPPVLGLDEWLAEYEAEELKQFGKVS